MSNLFIEEAITAAQSKLSPCVHTFVAGVCQSCFCPESPEFLNKALRLMESKILANQLEEN